MQKEERAPIRLTGVIFAVAANLLLVTIADMIVAQLDVTTGFSAILRLITPFLAGLLTALYIGERGGIHAAIGGLITIPLLALFVLSGAWQVSLLAGALCALGGSVMEVLQRRR